MIKELVDQEAEARADVQAVQAKMMAAQTKFFSTQKGFLDDAAMAEAQRAFLEALSDLAATQSKLIAALETSLQIERLGVASAEAHVASLEARINTMNAMATREKTKAHLNYTKAEVEAVRDSIAKETGKAPSQRALAERLKISQARVNQILKEAA